jgi:hypothetical protein
MTRAATAARAGAILGVTVVALQVLQQVVGAYDPRRTLAVVITVTFAAAAFALDRLRQRRQAKSDRESRLSAALCHWPLPTVAELDRRRLGVFPARPGGDDPYVPRACDPDLREAVKPGRFVLVAGPPRAGKSRTAREALPGDAFAIVPRDADGLRDLADIDPPPGARVSTVLWLDGLERFLPAVSDGVLDRLTGVPDPPAIVATMRSESFDALLGSSDPAARAVAGRARVFALPRELDQRGAEAAARLYPGLDVAQGIGPALASTGRDDAAPVPPPLPPPSHAPLDVPGHGQDGMLVGSGALAVAGVLLVGLVSLTAGFSEPTRPQRIARVIRDATGPGRQHFEYRADFHGTGEQTHVFVFHDVRVAPGGGAPRPPTSDELAVYDDSGEHGLRKRLVFQPEQPGWVFSYRYHGDVDGDGDAELIGGYGDPRDASQAQIPFMLDWDEAGERYRLTALQAVPPPRVGATRPSAEPFLAAYARRVTLTDGRTRLSGHRVQDFAVVKPQRVVAGVVLKARTFSIPGTIELEGNILRTSGGAPALVPCRFAHPRSPRVVWETGRRLDVQMATAWDELTRTGTCSPAAP